MGLKITIASRIFAWFRNLRTEWIPAGGLGSTESVHSAHLIATLHVSQRVFSKDWTSDIKKLKLLYGSR